MPKQRHKRGAGLGILGKASEKTKRGRKIKFDLIDHHPNVLEHFKVERKDREYQFFKERPLSVPLFTDSIVSQKMDYIHRNPIQPKWNLAEVPEAYPWSSAGFYLRADVN